MTYTPDINLGNILITSALTGLGWGFHKLYKLIDRAMDAQEQAIDDLDEHAEVINIHSNLFIEGGLVKGGIGIPRVEERRRRRRIYSGQKIQP